MSAVVAFADAASRTTFFAWSDVASYRTRSEDVALLPLPALLSGFSAETTTRTRTRFSSPRNVLGFRVCAALVGRVLVVLAVKVSSWQRSSFGAALAEYIILLETLLGSVDPRKIPASDKKHLWSITKYHFVPLLVETSDESSVGLRIADIWRAAPTLAISAQLAAEYSFLMAEAETSSMLTHSLIHLNPYEYALECTMLIYKGWVVQNHMPQSITPRIIALLRHESLLSTKITSFTQKTSIYLPRDAFTCSPTTSVLNLLQPCTMITIAQDGYLVIGIVTHNQLSTSQSTIDIHTGLTTHILTLQCLLAELCENHHRLTDMLYCSLNRYEVVHPATLFPHQGYEDNIDNSESHQYHQQEISTSPNDNETAQWSDIPTTVGSDNTLTDAQLLKFDQTQDLNDWPDQKIIKPIGRLRLLQGPYNTLITYAVVSTLMNTTHIELTIPPEHDQTPSCANFILTLHSQMHSLWLRSRRRQHELEDTHEVSGERKSGRIGWLPLVEHIRFNDETTSDGVWISWYGKLS